MKKFTVLFFVIISSLLIGCQSAATELTATLVPTELLATEVPVEAPAVIIKPTQELVTTEADLPAWIANPWQWVSFSSMVIRPMV
jgi:uncharacterized protein YcfL